MNILNIEMGKSVLCGEQSTVKFIMNQQALAFFSASQQHRDMKIGGLSYEDDYKGNAVAGILFPDKAEIRFHSGYSDDRIRAIWAAVRLIPGLQGLAATKLLYQGRQLG